MAACILVKRWRFWQMVKEIMPVKNATGYTYDWYRHLAGDRA
jgi:hypothetical protein